MRKYFRLASIIGLMAMFAGTAVAGDLFHENFADGVLGNDTMNGGAYASGYGNGGTLFATNTGRGVANAFGGADLIGANDDGLKGWRWNAPAGGLSFDPTNEVLFVTRTVISDVYYPGQGEPFLFNMDIEGQSAAGDTIYYFATGIPQEAGTKMRGAVWQVGGAFAGDLAQNTTFTYDPNDISGDPVAIDNVLANPMTYTVLFRDGDANGVTVETYGGVAGAKETTNLPAMAKVNAIIPTPDTTGFANPGDLPLTVYSSISAQPGNTVQFGDVEMRLGVTDSTDFNLDYGTDASDLLVWNTHSFTSGTVMQQGDANNDGNTDAADLLAWNTNKFTTNDLIGNETNDVADVIYDPGTGELVLSVNSDQVEAAIIIEVDDANVVDTANGLPLYLGLVPAWQYQYFSGSIQLFDTQLLAGGVPATPGDYLLATLATGLTAADFGLVTYGITGDTQETLVTVIPEPASMILLAVGASSLVRRRRTA